MVNLKKIEKKVFSKINSTIFNYQMVKDEDRLLVGLSGGKDSLVLLKSLSYFRKKVLFDFEMTAVYIDLEEVPYSANIQYLNDYCQGFGVNFVHKLETDFFGVENSIKSPCFVCSWARRKKLFEYAKLEGYNKLALGHHLDDAVETLLMNMMYRANISSLPPVIDMFDGKLTLVRPLIELKESLIIDYANVCEFKPMNKSCPYENNSSRSFIKEILGRMEDKYDRAKNNIFISMSNIDDEYLP